MKTIRHLLLTASIAIAACEAPPPGGNAGGETPLEGAWRIVEVTTAGASAPETGSVQPGLLIFSGRHFSLNRVTSREPRPAFPPADSTTLDDVLAILGPYASNAGTFEVRADTIIRHREVALNPGGMTPGDWVTWTYRMAGDTLWATEVASSATGPRPNPRVFKYVRVR